LWRLCRVRTSFQPVLASCPLFLAKTEGLVRNFQNATQLTGQGAPIHQQRGSFKFVVPVRSSAFSWAVSSASTAIQTTVNLHCRRQTRDEIIPAFHPERRTANGLFASSLDRVAEFASPGNSAFITVLDAHHRNPEKLRGLSVSPGPTSLILH